MTKIFISYRREDTRDLTGRIGDRLRNEFGKDGVFTDVDDILLGDDFRVSINEAVSLCDIFLAVIGNDWIHIKDENGENRLNKSNDFVRIEIEAALERKIPLIPVLGHGVVMPPETELPVKIRSLAYKNATKVRADPDFDKDIGRLISGIKKQLDKKGYTPAKKGYVSRAFEYLTSPKFIPVFISTGIIWSILGAFYYVLSKIFSFINV